MPPCHGAQFAQFAPLETRQEACATAGAASGMFGIEFAGLITVSRPHTGRRKYVPLAGVARPTISLQARERALRCAALV
jgi:hypothetical protein